MQYGRLFKVYEKEKENEKGIEYDANIGGGHVRTNLTGVEVGH